MDTLTLPNKSGYTPVQLHRQDHARLQWLARYLEVPMTQILHRLICAEYAQHPALPQLAASTPEEHPRVESA